MGRALTLFRTVTIPLDGEFRRLVPSENRVRRVVVTSFGGTAFVGTQPGSASDPLALLGDTVAVPAAGQAFVLLERQALFVVVPQGATANVSAAISDAINVS